MSDEHIIKVKIPNMNRPLLDMKICKDGSVLYHLGPALEPNQDSDGPWTHKFILYHPVFGEYVELVDTNVIEKAKDDVKEWIEAAIRNKSAIFYSNQSWTQ